MHQSTDDDGGGNYDAYGPRSCRFVSDQHVCKAKNHDENQEEIQFVVGHILNLFANSIPYNATSSATHLGCSPFFETSRIILNLRA